MKLLIFLFIGTPLFAAGVSEDFSTSAHLDAANSTAIWNLATQRLHLPRKIDRDETTLDAEDDDLFLGTGKDGAFAPTSNIVLNSDVVHEYTSFTIPSGVTVTCSGTAPLDIRVQGDVSIVGTLEVSGNGSTPGCGFANLGNGGNGSGTGAGGGGGYGNTGQVGNANGGTGGTAGGQYGDEFVSPLRGGSKGGNGGSGALGGGGGGALRISAGGAIRVDGTINAIGGAGAVDGGGANGGGGSGGAVVLFASGLIAVDGSVFAIGGDGPGVNGNGGNGFTRLTSDNPSFVPNGTIDPPPAQLKFGMPVFASTQNYVVTTKSYDTGQRRPDYSSFETVETLNGGTVTYEIAGSDDDFASDDTGFLATTNLLALRGKRYFKVRVTLRSTNPSTSPEVRAFTLSFDAFLPSFDFKTSCSAAHGPTTPASVLGSLAFLLYLCAVPFLGRRLSRRSGL